MADEEKAQVEPNAAEEKAAPKKKGGIRAYALVAGGVLALIIVTSLISLMLLKDNRAVLDTGIEPAKAVDTAAATDSMRPAEMLDSLPADSSSPDAIEKIAASLEFLDYKPTREEVTAEEDKMSPKDSIETVNWLDKEKSRLADKEKTIDARQRALEALDQQLTKKLLTLEQAESARVAELAKLYDGMDTRAVAKLMASLDDSTIVAILPRMKAKNASAVLELFAPQRAAQLSKRMITIADK